MENRVKVNILKNYLPMEYWELFDLNLILDRCKEVEEGIFCYDCHFIKLYFDENMIPVSYGKQKIIGDEVYYDLNKNSYGAGTLTFLAKIHKH